MALFFHRRILLQRALQASSCIIGMPLLECMLNTNGTAYANGNALESFYGTFFMGNGKAKNTWLPTKSTGNADPTWDCSTSDPLRAIIQSGCKPEISVITGLNAPSLRFGPHKHAQSLSLSGGVGQPNNNRSFAAATIDQIVAEHYGGESLVASCCKIVSGNANNMEKFISWKNTYVPNNSTLDPKQLFDNIFSVGSSGANSSNSQLATKKSILDQVIKDIQTLKNQGISAVDQQRLDDHMEALRSLEQQINNSDEAMSMASVGSLSQDIERVYPNGLGITKPGGISVKLSNKAAQIKARWDVLCKITALALSSGKRTAFALAFTHPGDQTPLTGQQHYPTRGVHSLAHTANANAQADLNRVTYYQVERFCQLVNTLKNHQDVTGNRLIDRGMVLCTSELDHGYGPKHIHNDIPMLLAGRANGTFNTGVHLKANGKHIGHAGLTALRATLGESADFRTPKGYLQKPDAPLEGLLDFSGTL